MGSSTTGAKRIAGRNLEGSTPAAYNMGLPLYRLKNTMLGGHHLDKQIIRRLGALNLEIDFDLYAEGDFFKD